MRVAGEGQRAPRALYVQYTNPAAYPPLEHSSDILCRAGWDVLFMALGAGTLRFPPLEGRRVLEMSYCPPGWHQKLHYLRFCLWVAVTALRWRPNWIYASDPLACLAVLPLSYLPRLAVLYHEHDSPGPGEAGVTRVALWARRRLARRARLCVLPNSERAALFSAETSCARLWTVWNCPRREEVRPGRGAREGPGLLLYYHGNLGPLYLPLTLLLALAGLPSSVRLRIVGYETIGARGYRQEIEWEAERLGLADRVVLLPPRSRHELWVECARADVGLALVPRVTDDVNNRHKLGASNRPFDYLACGLALLVSDLPEWRKAYVEPGYGLACAPEDPASIAAAVGWYLDNPERMRSMGEAGRKRVLDEWNYETRFEPILQELRSEADGCP